MRRWAQRLALVVLLSAYLGAADFEAGKRAYDRGDWAGALKEWGPLAASGDARAQEQVASIYYDLGEYGRSAYWYKRSASNGNPDAGAGLAIIYFYGHGIKQDSVAAVKWAKQSAERGSSSGKSILDFLNGQIEELRTYRAQALRGDASAQLTLGFYLERGIGVPRDDGEAAKWYLVAAKGGNREAQSKIASFYLSGRGVREDQTEAIKWLQAASAQGHPGAQYSLGILYAHGKGVPKDYAQAVALWRKVASSHGSLRDKARFNLGVAYLNGNGVPEDHTQAYAWFNLASMATDSRTAAGARKARERIETTLSSIEVSQAQALSRSWNESLSVPFIGDDEPVGPPSKQ